MDAWGLGGPVGVTAGYGVWRVGDENASILTGVMVAQLSEYTKNQ